MKFRVQLIFLLLTSIVTFSQESYIAFHIPSELKENANAVIRNQELTYELNDIDELIITKKRVITVLNRFGDRFVDAYENYDDSRNIQKLSIIVLDQFGSEIKKVKQSDFNDISVVSGGQLYTDNRVKYYEYMPNKYPYTIVYTSRVKEKSTAFIANWYPLEDYYVSVEKSVFKFVNNTSIDHKTKGYNLDGVIITESNSERNLRYEVSNLKAIEKEYLSPSFREIMPKISVALNEFELKGTKGIATNWSDFGKWQYEELLLGRDELDQETIDEVTLLVSNLSSEKEKVQKIYKYVQDNTRYVGVQLGIGGWQPILAKEVDKVKYGDCKGLTNYTKALLKSQGIEAYYTIVHAGKEKISLDKDFTSLQGNHVILNVPLKEEEVWLECTSQTAPFGFLGSFTDDRDVLVVTPKGGEIRHTPVYSESLNTLITKAEVFIKPDSKIETTVELKSKGLQYDDRSYLSSLTKEEKEIEYLNRWDYLNGIKITKLEVDEDKEGVLLSENIGLILDKYLTKVGDKYLLQLNMFNRLSSLPTNYEDRKLPFRIGMSFKDIDEYKYHLPKNMTVESLPEDIVIEGEFGSYKVSVSKVGESLFYRREFRLKGGVYNKDYYKIYRGFLKKIKRKDKLKVVLVNK